jgi:hypothetical protein
MSKTKRLGKGQHILGNQGLGFVYMKLGETREVWVLFMKPERMQQRHCFSGRGHCFPGIEILLALYNFLLCTDGKIKICQLVISLLVFSICVLPVHSFPEPFWVKNLCNLSRYSVFPALFF